MAQVLDGGIWRKATGAAFDRMMRDGRTARRLQADERTMEKARARSARIRTIKEQKADRDYQVSVLRILRDLGLAPGGDAWGRMHRVKVRKAPERKSGGRKMRSPRPSGRRVNMPKYSKAIRDRRGRVAVFLQMSYLGLKSKGWRAGLPADHAKYCQRADALEEPEIQFENPLSNVAQTPEECAALWKAIEPVEQGYRANAKVQFRTVAALPYEFTAAQRRDVLREFGEQAFGRYGLGWMAFAHVADEGGDPRNIHGHILATTRQVVRLGDNEWAIGEEKLTELFTPEGMKRIRAIYAAVLNRHCRKNGLEDRYTHQSYQERGIDAFRTEKIGPARMAAYEAGEDVAVVGRNRARIAANEAGVEAQFFERKLVLQERLAVAAKHAVEAANAAQRFTNLRQHIQAIPGVVKRVGHVIRPRPLRVHSEVRGAVQVIARCAVPAAAHRPARIASGYRSAVANVVERAAPSTAGRIAPGLRHHTISHALRPALANIAAASRQASQALAGKPRKAIEPRLRGKVAAIITVAATASAALGSPVRQPAAGHDARWLIGDLCVTVNALQKADRHRPRRRIAEAARTLIDRMIDIAMRTPVPPARPIERLAVDRLQGIERRAQRLAAVPRAARLDRKAVADIAAVRDLADVMPTGPATALRIGVAESRALAASIIARVHAPRGHAKTITTKNAATALPDSPRPSAARPPRIIGPGVKGSAQPPPALAVSPAVAARNPDASAPASAAIEPPATAMAELSPLNERVAAFAQVMHRKPSGLVVWDDGSVRPVAARADSWGLAKADLASATAKRELLPLYVEQELRFDRLETELKFADVSEKELDDPETKLAHRLSKEAAKTLEIYRRSQLLREALHRVHRELWRGEKVTSRTRQMDQRGIDWRAIDEANRQRRKALAAAAQQAFMRQNGIG